MALSNSSWDSRLTTTIPLWVSENFADLISGNDPLWWKLRSRGNMKGGQSGHGGSYLESLMFPDGAQGSSGPGMQTITSNTTAYSVNAALFAALGDTTNFTSAQYSVAEKLMPISVTEFDVNAQGSKTEKFDLIATVIKSKILQFNQTLISELWADEDASQSSGGIAARGKLQSIRSLLNGCGATTSDLAATPLALTEQGSVAGTARAVTGTSGATAQFTIGGINRNATGAAYWCTPIRNTSEALTFTSLSKVVSMATRGKDKPDLIILHRDMYDKLMNIMTFGGSSGGQMFSNSKLADAGFEAIKFRGADVIMDDHCPTTCYTTGSATALGYNAFAINTEYLKLRANTMKPKIVKVEMPGTILYWKASMNIQLTSNNTGRVHARHVNLS